MFDKIFLFFMAQKNSIILNVFGTERFRLRNLQQKAELSFMYKFILLTESIQMAFDARKNLQ